MQLKVAVCSFTLIAWLAPLSGLATASPVVLHDVEIIADKTFIRGADASVHVAVFGATDFTEHQPLPGTHVHVSLVPAATGEKAGNTRAALELASTTSADGTLSLRFAVPRDLATGDYELVIHSRSRHGSDTTRQSVAVIDATRLHLRTDRGMYAPGQSVYWRVMAINAGNAHPLPEQPIEVTIEDPRGTALWRGTRTTDATGMIHGDIPLGRDLILGTYTLIARAANVETRESIKVRAYRLPAFTMAIEPAGKGPYQPGSTLKGRVVARYLHGEPVAGQVTLRARSNGSSRTVVEAKLDKHGRAPFSLTIPGSARELSLDATIVESSGRRESSSTQLELPPQQLEIAVIPEKQELARGAEQWITVLTTDGHGALVPAELRVHAGDEKRRLQSRGALRLPITTTALTTSVRVHATTLASPRHTAGAEVKLSSPHSRHRFIRPRNAVVRGGEAIEITGMWSYPHGPVAVTLLRKGSPMATTVASVDKEGKLHARITPPPGVFGLATVRVTDARWDDRSGSIQPAIDQASVFIRPTELDVSIHGATRYKPGQVARLAVTVRDRAGQAVAGAGLAASVVDERALMLAEPGPDLITALRALDTGDAEVAGLVFARLLDSDSDENRAAMRALIEALPETRVLPEVHITAADRMRDEIERMDKVRDAAFESLLRDPRAIGKKHPDEDGASWEFARPLDQVLARGGWSRAKRLTPWRRSIDWAYARRLAPQHFDFDDMAEDLAERRLDLLAAALRKHRRALRGDHSLARLVAAGKVARYLAVDPWGTRVRLEREIIDGTLDQDLDNDWNLRAAGPDLVFETDDDIVYRHVFTGTLHAHGYGVGSGYGGMRGRRGGVPSVRVGAAGNPEAVAVRKRFDQTVLWVAGVRTGSAGEAALEVPLADSVTGWRVDVEALGPRGSVGTGRARLETTLPMYLDVDMPGALTVGDRYELPVVVANHTGAAAELEVHAAISGSVTLARKSATRRVILPAGATAMVPVPVRARVVGQGTVKLTLRHAGGPAVDAVKHTMEVQAPGHRVRVIPSAITRGDDTRFSFTVPESRAKGTVAGTLRLYRGVVDQAVDGLEGMLQEPYGCFEQTSSTTYPNLLVLGLLDDKPGTAAVRARARDLVAKGYQRLISYEVEGGGFSWFGEAPANQVLTAYGLMQFVDMARVYPVDEKLIARTRDWLLGKQNADGSWNKDYSWLHNWSAVQGRVSTTVYIAWALAESGYRGKPLDRAFAYLADHRDAIAGDPYLLALWAAAESARGGAAPGARNQALALLRKRGKNDGNKGLRFAAGDTTLFYAKGTGADVQVTALAALALKRAKSNRDASAALSWLWTARSPNHGWGTTQGTVLALRAAQAIVSRKPVTGTIEVHLDGEPLGTVDLDGQDGVPSLALPEGLAPGRHELSLRGAGEALEKGALRADLRVSWRNSGAPAAEAQGMVVRLSSSQMPVRVGQRYDMTLLVQNPGAEAIAMPTAVIPVPPGFRADAASLDALERGGRVEKAEDMGSEIHLYMSKLDPRASLVLPYRLEALAVCDVAQGSARAYAYYDPETRAASAPLRLGAEPRE